MKLENIILKKKKDSREYMLYDSIYMNFLNRQN